MGFFTRKFKERDEKELELGSVDTRMELLKESRLELEDLTEDVYTDVKKLCIEEDVFDEKTVKIIPYITKYLKRYDRLMDLSWKAAEIEIKKAETAEETFAKMQKELSYVANATERLTRQYEEQNKILERIAKSLEKK